MVDIHSHLLFGIDDGAEDLEESLRMVYAAQEAGVKTIIATPHFREHIINPEKTYENYSVLLEKIKDTNVEVRLGFEIMLNPMLEKIIDVVEKHSINGTDYLLVEFSHFTFGEQGMRLLELLYRYRFIPVIAHPERVKGGFSRKKTIKMLKEMGCLMQINAGSIIGIYGQGAKRMAKYLIKKKMADFVASDAHSERFYKWYGEAYKHVVRWSDEEYANDLFFNNGRKLLGGEYIAAKL